jgi:hypothetical protein
MMFFLKYQIVLVVAAFRVCGKGEFVDQILPINRR